MSACSYEFYALGVLPHSSHLKHTSFPPCTTHWFSTAHDDVEENLLTPGIRQENLKLTTLPHFTDNTKNKKLISWPHSTSSLLLVTLRTKWCYSGQSWCKNNILHSNAAINSTNKIFCFLKNLKILDLLHKIFPKYSFSEPFAKINVVKVFSKYLV